MRAGSAPPLCCKPGQMNKVCLTEGNLGTVSMVSKRRILFGGVSWYMMRARLRELFCERVVTASLLIPTLPPMQTAVGSIPLGAPAMLGYAAPVVALAAALLAGGVWRAGVRQYRSTGS